MSLKTLAPKNFFSSRITDMLTPWEDWFDNGKSLFKSDWSALNTPAVNVTENEKEYQLTLAAPGLKKEDFKIEMRDDMLTISSEKKEDKEEKNEKYTRKEYSYSSFSRSFTLPAEVAKDKIDAQYENGILSISMPKEANAEKASVKSITIK